MPTTPTCTTIATPRRRSAPWWRRRSAIRAVFVSVGAMHQGPHGGGPVTAIVDVGE
jgi:hypothetical protein